MIFQPADNDCNTFYALYRYAVKDRLNKTFTDRFCFGSQKKGKETVMPGSATGTSNNGEKTL
ncbi:MAG: hypothetical protein CR981_04190 [Proteobacteria bacterium]|nr:MAG: hypothetical protein CR981_04190 [Pseudomonadota bacterium]